ncbi:nosL [bacterium BMS3Bbin02]|nr:nosL [bacterium BMS3Bbin02]
MRIVLHISIALVLVVSACGSTEVSTEPEIRYGRDVCVQCGMIASEAKFAATYRVDGEDFVFDDIGDLVVHARNAGIELDAEQTWVHDFETEASMVAGDAYFVPTISVATPMGHGVVAFVNADRAKTFADSLGGQVIAWEALIKLPIVEGRVGAASESFSGEDADE